ncbi:metal ABC transporter permease, partial [Rhodovulum sulfidophilum]|nr:metal ABC transporter permease [Rhodovulum sulfidophilum]
MRRGRRPTTADLSQFDREQGMRTIRKVAPYLWPQGQGWVKRRVVLALAALFLAKVVSVGTPFLYKAAVDK